MSDTRVRLVTEFPDHGLGELGRVAHGVLHGCREAGPTEEARLFLGLNTLPDQSSPFPGYIGFPAQPGAWSACGGNLMVFLMSAAR